MKKYVKPDVYYENLQISQNIARCDYNFDQTLTDVNTCVAYEKTKSVALFSSNNGACSWPLDNVDQYCLFKSTGGLSTYNS